MSVEDGIYYIYNIQQDKNLDLEDFSTLPGTRINGFDPVGTAAQKWSVTNTGSGITIKSVLAAPGQDVFVRSTAIIEGGLFVSGTDYTFWLEEKDQSVYYIKPSNGTNLVATLPLNVPHTQVIWTVADTAPGQFWTFNPA
ncbi:hypothetical protein C8J56DRAFT_1173923 [Mycena floridula]|nr:hypothetical protein C8J56DRAFT_1173923 [Mycena floridula]